MKHPLAEKLIAAVIPGGQICDPQKVADDIRDWFAKNWPAKLSAKRLDNAITRTINGLMGRAPFDQTESLFALCELAARERQLTAAAKAVLKASEGTHEGVMDEALDQLRKAVK